MFEVHGWAVLRVSTHDAGDEIRKEAELDTAIRGWIESVKSFSFIVWNVYGDRTAVKRVTVDGCCNHRKAYVIEFFDWLAANAPGSYGLLYVRDDEDFGRGRDNTNDFRAWRLARGTLEELDDPFLSPCIPTIEDEYDPDRDL